MKRNLIKMLFRFGLFIIPFLLLLILYLSLDPFKVVYKYKSYFRSGYPAYVTLDRDYVSTQTFINNYPIYNYDSFIFGNSRSLFYQIETWKKYINSDKCFHFDAYGESLLGINRKFKYLNKRNVKISNSLIILDFSILCKIDEKKEHICLSHPALSNQNMISFQLEFFKVFLSPKFFKAYLDFKISHQVKDYMKNDFLLSDLPYKYIEKNNEIQFENFDKQIHTDKSLYYNEKKMKVFYKRDSIQKFSQKVILETQYKMLSEISDILKKNKTNYKIIINPLYDQMKLNNDDILLLYRLFGKNNVFDYSGINFITNDYQNFYETSHYRPPIAEYIMKEIYK